MSISVIIPTLNEELSIVKTLEAVSRLVNVAEIIVVDGGSSDKTTELVKEFQSEKEIKVVETSQANRGKQLDKGTKHAAGEIFWFIHADTRPVQGCGKQIKELMRYDEIVGGNFEIIFDGTRRWARILTWLYPKLRVIGLVYGDSAMFTKREVYERIGGFRDLPLFEDADFYKRLKKEGQFAHINLPVTTSSRRFENNSFLWTFAKWSIFQGLYWFGVPPKFLAAGYKQIR